MPRAEVQPLEGILQRLRQQRAALEAAGVRHAGVFGSLARGEAGPASDIDVIIDIDYGRVGTLTQYARLRADVAETLREVAGDRHIDVSLRSGMSREMAERVGREEVRAY